VITPLGQPQEFQVKVDGQKHVRVRSRALVEFQQKVARLQRAVSGATEAANALKPRLAAIRRALLETPSAGESLLADASALDKRTNEVLRALRGDTPLRQRNMNLPLRSESGSVRLSARTNVDRAADADARESIRGGLGGLRNSAPSSCGN